MNTTFSEALKPIADRLPRLVREHEILRVRGVLPGPDSAKAAEAARTEVLRWAQKRSGGRLPKEAWDLQGFEHLSGGRNSASVRIQREASDIWAIRADDPDKNVAERIWTTEVVVGFVEGQSPRFSARLLVSTPEEALEIEPHTPGFVQQIAVKCGLSRDGYAVRPEPWAISSDGEADALIDLLVSNERRLPAFVFTLPVGVAAAKFATDPVILAKAVLGIGHVVAIPAEYTWRLTEAFGKKRSVFGGAARAYLPGFGEDSNPYDHRLFLAESIATPDGAAKCSRWMRQLAAADSLRRLRLGHDVLSFSSLKAARLQMGQEALERSGANEADRIAAMDERIIALEKKLAEDATTIDYFAMEHGKAEERAVAAEGQAQSSAYRIQQLIAQLQQQGKSPDSDVVLPATWMDFADWCDEVLAGRVVLAPNARRGVKSAIFEDIELAARCLLWLANDGRDLLMNGGGTVGEAPVVEGVKNSHCGSDAFEVQWRGQRHTVEWHVKTGGNTRAPERCLRIYYFWDPATMQIVVAEMPAHRRTDAS